MKKKTFSCFCPIGCGKVANMYMYKHTFTLGLYWEWSLYVFDVSCSPVKMWYPPLTSHLSHLYSERDSCCFNLCCLLLYIASLPTTQKHFDWADLVFYLRPMIHGRISGWDFKKLYLNLAGWKNWETACLICPIHLQEVLLI